MASFIVRVELHYATSEDYDQLHDAMEAVGFSRFIKGDDGFWYHLPDAEYTYSGAATIEQVYDAAVTAASSTGRSYYVFVTEYLRAQWYLRRVAAKTA